MSDPSWFEVDDCYEETPPAGNFRDSDSGRMGWLRSRWLGPDWHLLMCPSDYLGKHAVESDRVRPRQQLRPE